LKIKGAIAITIQQGIFSLSGRPDQGRNRLQNFYNFTPLKKI